MTDPRIIGNMQLIERNLETIAKQLTRVADLLEDATTFMPVIALTPKQAAQVDEAFDEGGQENTAGRDE